MKSIESIYEWMLSVKKTAIAGIAAACAFALGGTASGMGLDRSEFHIGCFSFNEPAQTPKHIAEARACGMDYVGGGIDARNRIAMEAFSENGLAASCIFLPRICGPHPARGTEALRRKLPKDRLENNLNAFNAKFRHPSIAMMNICDEPPVQSMAFLGDMVRLVDKCCPGGLAYVNLYPNYARVAENGTDVTKSQLGCANYRDYIDEYCRQVPTHYIAYDHYPIMATAEATRACSARWYGNLKVVADACRATGRDLWVGPQVNSRRKAPPITENHLRYQAFSAMAFGAVNLTWACWTLGWWDNNLMETNGMLTCQYPKLKKVNFEVRRIAPAYMKMRNVATHFVGFKGEANALSKYGIVPVERLDVPGFDGIAATDGSSLVVGEMVSRVHDGSAKAVFIYAANDSADEKRAEHVVEFSAHGQVSVLGPDEGLRIAGCGQGRCRLTLSDNSCALVWQD